ncbi:2,3-bisphosphoglycerate-independent phosphoglycerate mutase [Candidatus Saccharibacteria bacterium]|nr:2,3-bisphosphoglycerate-independent phosphoglycerate mutase [Candidatus Saccharibacteria bacterium]
MKLNYAGPVCLIILDGFGLSDNPVGNAIMVANTPTLDKLFANYPWAKLKASGTAVGLPSDSDIGNSEVGHNAMGAGRIYAQGARLVNEAIANGAVFRGDKWRQLIDNAKSGHTLHFFGLLSDRNVHSHIDQLFALLDEAAHDQVPTVRIHILLDGRDAEPRSALQYIDELEKKLAEINARGLDYKIADGGGRMQITMDRYEANWPMVERGWTLMTRSVDSKTGQPASIFPSAHAAVEKYYGENPDTTDQDIPPFVVADSNGQIKPDDSVILFNFRGDRAIEISQAFEGGPNFDKFDRGVGFENGVKNFAGLLEYDSEKRIPKSFLVSPPVFTHTLGEEVAKAGLRQLAISETQKIGHVTYFFNGNRAAPFNPELEDYVEIPSDRVSFDTEPAMKSVEIADKLIELLKEKKYQFVRVNFPNPDMVGHTGNYDATVKAIEAVDTALARILPVIDEVQGMAIITGDHGNAEEMYELNDDGSAKLDKNGQPVVKTAHTTNRVPAIFYDNTPFAQQYQVRDNDDLGLANFASTIAELLGIPSRPEWLKSIIEIKS